MEAGDTFTWAFTVFQWNCMTRSIDIDELTFSQLSLGKDSLIVKYCNTKMDQAGEKTSPKNCYSNPFNPFVCIFTALGCFVALNEETWVSTKNTIFRAKDSKPGTASHIYCNRIKEIFGQYVEK